MLISNDFSMADMLAIGQAQTQRVQQLEAQAKRVIFCDTDLITTQIYAQLYLDEVAPRLYQYEAEISYDLYFLLDIDVPWVADGLRDLGHRRGEVLGVFEQALIQRQIDYVWVRGDWATRWQTVLDTLAERFGLFP
jgi:nicotinamide riboside kinase